MPRGHLPEPLLSLRVHVGLRPVPGQDEGSVVVEGGVLAAPHDEHEVSFQGHDVPSLHLGQERLVIVVQSDEAGAGQTGVWDCHDLPGGAGGVGAPAVGGVVDPAVPHWEVSLVLAGVPVVAAQPDVVLATVDSPDHPPAAPHLGDVRHLLDCVLRPRQADPVWRDLREAAVRGHAAQQVDEWLVVQAQRHLALKLALALVWPAVTAYHALQGGQTASVQHTGGPLQCAVEGNAGGGVASLVPGNSLDQQQYGHEDRHRHTGLSEHTKLQ